MWFNFPIVFGDVVCVGSFQVCAGWLVVRGGFLFGGFFFPAYSFVRLADLV